MKICLNKLFREPDLITLWMLLACLNKTIDGKAGSLWYNLNQESHKSDENQDPHIHKGVLVWHHDHNSEKNFLPWLRNGVGMCAVETDACHRYRLRCCPQHDGRSYCIPAQISKELLQQRHEQKHECEGFHKFVSEISDQANGRKTELVDLVRLSVLRNDIKFF